MARVLITDDDDGFVAMLSTFLEAVGHEVSHAPDPDRMAALLRQGAPDVLVLDMELPGPGGAATSSPPPNLPVICLSGLPIEEMQRRVPPTPLRRYMNKPPDLLRLKAALEELLASRR